MIWWLVSDGVAIAHPDTAETRARVDAAKRNREQWFGTIEGCIKHGGVIATAFKRTTERTYDAARWLLTNGKERVPTGTVTITEVTASPAGCEGAIMSDYDMLLDDVAAEMSLAEQAWERD